MSEITLDQLSHGVSQQFGSVMDELELLRAQLKQARDTFLRSQVTTVYDGLGTIVPDVIYAGGSNSLGPFISATIAAAPTSAAWGTANLARYIPFTVTIPTTIYKLCVMNGATVAGNFDIAIFSTAYVKLVSTGSTAQAGVNTLQTVDVTDTELDTGRYYMGMSSDDATATTYRWFTPTTGMAAIMGLRTEASAFPLPTTATPIQSTSTSIPVFGAMLRSDF